MVAVYVAFLTYFFVFTTSLYCLISVYSEKNGWTALQIAAWNGHASTIQALINGKARVDLQNAVRCIGE